MLDQIRDLAMSLAAVTGAIVGLAAVARIPVIAVLDPTIGLIAVAVIGAVGGIGASWAANTARKDVADRIGTPNGQGNVVEMMERLLAGQTGQDQRLAVMEARQLDQAARLGRVEQSVGLDPD